VKHALAMATCCVIASCGGRPPETHDTVPTPVAATALTTPEVLAIFERSCAGCHRHEGGDPAAVEHGAYFDTEADIRRLMSSYGVGIAQSGLMSMLATLERDGELRIGTARELMPPEGSAQPPISRVEARQIRDWQLAAH
jgi:hypothetical protein